MIHGRAMAKLRGCRISTLQWVDLANNRRLLEPIANIPSGRGRTTSHDSIAQTKWPRGQARGGSPCLICRACLVVELVALGSVEGRFEDTNEDQILVSTPAQKMLVMFV